MKDLDAATIRTLAQEFAKTQSTAVVVVNLAGNFVVAGPGAVPIAKKLAQGRAGGKDNLAQGSIPGFAAQDTKQAADALRKTLG